MKRFSFFSAFSSVKSINLYIIIEWLSILLTFFIVLHLSLRPFIAFDTDLFWHLAAGQDMWHLKSVYLKDTFSHTRYGYQWINYSWGFELIVYFLYSLGGLNTIILFRSFLFLFPMSCLFYTARLRGAGLFISLIITLWASLILSSYWWVRPQMVSLCMGSLFLLIFELVINGKEKLIFLFPVLMVIWANLHGGVSLIGLALIIVYSIIYAIQKIISGKELYKRQKYLFIVIILCILSIFISPHTFKTPYHIISCIIFPDPFKGIITEAQKPDFLTPACRITLFFMISVLSGAVYMIKKKRFFDVSLVVVFIPLIFGAERHHLLLLPFFVPTVSVFFDDIIKSLMPHIALLNRKWFNNYYNRTLRIIYVIFLFILLAREGLMIFRLACPPARLIRWETFPDSTCNFLIDNKIKGNLFNSLTSGGYLIWKLKNLCPVYIDPRDEAVYDVSLVREYLYILNGNEKAFTILDNRKIDIIFQSLLYDNFPFFNKLLPASKEWFIAYEDTSGRIYLRKSRFYNLSKTFTGLNGDVCFMPHLLEGQRLLDKGMTEEGISEMEKSQALYPDCPRCQLWLGMAYARTGNYISAIRQWELMLLLHYPVAIRGVYYNMGLMELNIGNPEKAACYLSEELRNDPNNKDIKARLSELPRHNHSLCFIKFAWHRFWAPFFVW